MASLPAPFLSREEVLCGPVLGNGAFCKVSAVKSIVLKEIPQPKEQEVSLYEGQSASPSPSSSSSRLFSRAARDLDGQEDARKQLVSINQCSRLAMKELKDSSKENLAIAKNDLCIELNILKKIRADNHPHIIKLIAVGVESFEEEDAKQPTFLILGKVRATISNFMYSWRERRGMGLFQYLGVGVQQFRDLWLERLLVLSKISSAIRFLHTHRIVYRDLKPDNVGFDAENVPKLFDFGLGKVIEEKDFGELNDTYQLTGNAGSLRYMAPEVANEKPYGMSVDVYSLSILMHQVLSLKVPFCGIPRSQFKDQVFDQGVRPPLDQTWPEPLQKLFRAMWDENPKSRPKSQEVHSAFEDMLRGDDAGLFPSDMQTKGQV